MRFCLALGLLLWPGIVAAKLRDEVAPVVDLSKLSVPELVKRLETAPAPKYSFPKKRWKATDHSEAIFSELIRRKGNEAEKLISKELQRQIADFKAAEKKLCGLNIGKDFQPFVGQDRAFEGLKTYLQLLRMTEKEIDRVSVQQTVVDELRPNLQMLTAYRRLQGKPDPLSLEVMLVDDLDAWVTYNDVCGRRYFEGQTGVLILRKLQSEFASTEQQLATAQKKRSEIGRARDESAWKAQSDAVDVLRDYLKVLKQTITVAEKLAELAPRVVETPVPKILRAPIHKLPVFIAALKSSDADRIPVSLTFGGDDRSGRLTQWRMEIRNAKGQLLPARKIEGRYRGGVSSQVLLESGESWRTSLSLSEFVEISEVGEYTVTLLYHDEIAISDFKEPQELRNLLIYRSAPFTLQVVPEMKRVVQLRPGSRRKTGELAQVLPDDGVVKVVVGAYDKSFFSFVDPASIAGQLLAMKWQAVPELLSVLDGDELTRHQKAWVLSLLFTMTQEQDLAPRGYPGALPKYEWQLTRHYRGFTSASEFDWKIDPKVQDKLIAAWHEYRRRELDIREALEDSPSTRKP